MNELMRDINQVTLYAWEFCKASADSIIKIENDGTLTHTHLSLPDEINEEVVNNLNSLKVLNNRICILLQNLKSMENAYENPSDANLLLQKEMKPKVDRLIEILTFHPRYEKECLPNVKSIFDKIKEKTRKITGYLALITTRQLVDQLNDIKESPTVKKLKTSIYAFVDSHLFPAISGQISKEQAQALPPLLPNLQEYLTQELGSELVSKYPKFILTYAIEAYFEIALRGAYIHRYSIKSKNLRPAMNVYEEAREIVKSKNQISKALIDRGGESYLALEGFTLGDERDEEIMEEYLCSDTFLQSCTNEELAVSYFTVCGYITEQTLPELNPYSEVLDKKTLDGYIKTIKIHAKKDFPEVDFSNECNLIAAVTNELFFQRNWEIYQTECHRHVSIRFKG